MVFSFQSYDEIVFFPYRSTYINRLVREHMPYKQKKNEIRNPQFFHKSCFRLAHRALLNQNNPSK